jgi:CRISPR-associated protein Cmr4
MADAGTTSRAGALLGLLAETSVHAGVGTQVGVVDLPIQRERHTGWPTIYGSGLKGVLRDEARAAGWTAEELRVVFGPEPEPGRGGREEDRGAGTLALSDARILAFPVRTAGFAFAWVTCPLALSRLARDAGHAGLQPPGVRATPAADRPVVTPDWPGREVFVEEFVYEQPEKSTEAGNVAAWLADHLLPRDDAYGYWRQHLKRAFVILHDDEFGDVVRHATEVTTRVRLEDGTKRVETGALWTEEHLPADSLLYAVAAAWRANGAAPERVRTPAGIIAQVGELISQRPVIQVGGKETVGRGMVALRLAGGGHAQAR